MTTTPTLIDIIFCDDVREEKNGRYSLMGVYPTKEISVQQLPTIINQLNLVMRFTGIPADYAPFLQVKITAPDGQDSRPVQGQILTPTSAEGETLFILCASPLQLSQEGRHMIQIKIDDDGSQDAYFNVIKTE
ncbi:MAG: hypothetical protein KBT51_09955 [Cycloclasticus sp.]|nr:hypothetical protein [Cycloclasticus sp.]